jgi:hypothetical protein
MVPPLPGKGKNQFFALAVIVLGITLMVVWAALQAGCSDSQDRHQVDTEPCELVCYSIDACYGFEGPELTFEACLDSCQESTSAENNCYQGCDSIMDCDTWFDCILQC